MTGGGAPRYHTPTHTHRSLPQRSFSRSGREGNGDGGTPRSGRPRASHDATVVRAPARPPPAPPPAGIPPPNPGPRPEPRNPPVRAAGGGEGGTAATAALGPPYLGPALPLTSGRPASPRRGGGRVRPCTAAAGTLPPSPTSTTSPPPLSADGSPHPGPPSYWRDPPVTPLRDRPAPRARWEIESSAREPTPSAASSGRRDELQFPQCPARSPGAERPGPARCDRRPHTSPAASGTPPSPANDRNGLRRPPHPPPSDPAHLASPPPAPPASAGVGSAYPAPLSAARRARCRRPGSLRLRLWGGPAPSSSSPSEPRRAAGFAHNAPRAAPTASA